VTPSGYATPDTDSAGSQVGAIAVGDPKGAINLKAARKSANSVLLTWEGLIAGHQYRLRRRVGSGVPAIIATFLGTMTQYMDRLPDGIGDRVGYFIEDMNGKGASQEVLLTINTATIDSAKARTDSAGAWSKGPSNLKATVKSASSVGLTYDVTPGAAFVRILRRMGGGQFVEVGRVPGTVSSFTDTFPVGTLAGAVTYAIEAIYGTIASRQISFTIDPAKARIDTAGSKDRSASAEASKGPANPKAVRTLPLQVRVTWDQVAGATGYEIRRAIANGGYQVVATIGPFVGLALAFVDALPVNLPIDAPVRYAISALSPKGRSLESVVIALPFQPATIDSAKSWSERTDSIRPPRERSRE
jgi:hypothetical protein